MRDVFGDRRVPISSMKSMLGHCMGAASALEAIGCVFTIETGIYPPTIGYETPDPECDVDVVANVARRGKSRRRRQQLARVRRLQRGHGLREAGPPAADPARAFGGGSVTPRAVTGFGVASALGVGREAFLASYRRRDAAPASATAGSRPSTPPPYPGARVAEVPDFDATKYLGDKGLRTLDRLTKLLVVASRLALHDAGLKRDGAWTPARPALARARRHRRVERLRLARGDHRARSRRGARGRAVHQPVALPAHGVQQRGRVREHLGGPARAQRERERRQLRRARRGRVRRRPARSGARGRAPRRRRGGDERGAVSRVPPARRDRLGLERREGPCLGEGAALLALERSSRRGRALGERARRGHRVRHGVRAARARRSPGARHAGRARARDRAARWPTPASTPRDVDVVVSGVSGLRVFDEAELLAIERALGTDASRRGAEARARRDARAPAAPWECSRRSRTSSAERAVGPLERGVGAWVRGPLRADVRTALVTSVGYYGNASALVMRAASR